MREKATNSMSQAHQKYHVMLILTDGAIMDMKQTVDEIVCVLCGFIKLLTCDGKLLITLVLLTFQSRLE